MEKRSRGKRENPMVPVARSRVPAARSTAKSTANAIEYSLAVRERKGDHESTWYLNQLGTTESGRPNVGCVHVDRVGRNSSRKNECALYAPAYNSKQATVLCVSARARTRFSYSTRASALSYQKIIFSTQQLYRKMLCVV